MQQQIGEEETGLSRLVRYLRQTSKPQLLLLGVIAAIIFVLLTAGSAQTASSDQSKVVDLFYHGQLRSVPTTAPTVGDFLERLEIKILPQDLVEPDLETEIDSDNFQVNIYSASPVVIADGGQKQTILSPHSEPSLIVLSAGYELAPKDEVAWANEALDFNLSLTRTLKIHRHGSYKLRIDGQTRWIDVHAKHVYEILDQAEVDIGPQTMVFPDLEQLVPEGATITVVNSPNSIEEEVQTINFEKQLRPDYNLPIGQRVIKVAGQVGQQRLHYEVIVGQAKTLIAKEVIQAPITQIEVYGAKAPTGQIIEANRKELMRQAGIAESDWFYVDYIVFKESSWRVQATNSKSGAYGLCQALPATKMASAGSDWRTNPITQLRWCDSYAHQRYGSWQASYRAWLIKHWW